MDELDVTAVAKGMKAQFAVALAPFDANSVTLSREEAVLSLGLISALVDVLERDEATKSYDAAAAGTPTRTSLESNS